MAYILKKLPVLKIVDSNYLRRDELRHYLSSSLYNRVVLTDYVAMEAYKGDIYAAMEVLSLYPSQVIVLKNTRAACKMSGRAAGLRNRLIDAEQTADFPSFCRNLKLAQAGDLGLQKQILDFRKSANQHMDKILLDAETMSLAFDALAVAFTPAELKIIRSDSVYTKEIATKIIRSVLLLTKSLFSSLPIQRRLPPSNEVANTFVFRAALCNYLLALKWISVGGVNNIKATRLRNDLVDTNFVAFATYFDGFLSTDEKAQEIYTKASFLLQNSFI